KKMSHVFNDYLRVRDKACLALVHLALTVVLSMVQAMVSCTGSGACKIDHDCLGAMICFKGSCVDPGRVCGSVLCPEGYTCVHGSCTLPEGADAGNDSADKLWEDADLAGDKAHDNDKGYTDIADQTPDRDVLDQVWPDADEKQVESEQGLEQWPEIEAVREIEKEFKDNTSVQDGIETNREFKPEHELEPEMEPEAEGPCMPLGCSPALLCQGIIDDGCGGRMDCGCSPSMVVPGLADPDVIKVDNGLFWLSGTLSGRNLGIYVSSDLIDFNLATTYDPSQKDSGYDYYCVWAPDFAYVNGKYRLYFSAKRVTKGQANTGCDNLTTYYAEAPSLSPDFGRPQPIDNPRGTPRSYFSSSCPPDGCRNAIRIDSALHDFDGDQWMYYVWFEEGNNIASFPLERPGDVMTNITPVEAYEKHVVEGPDVFERNDIDYLFFSGGGFTGPYAMYYVMGTSPYMLTRSRHVYRYSWPLKASNGDLIQNHGHDSVVEHRGEYYIFYHQGVFENGSYANRRDTYRQRLFFEQDGRLVDRDQVRVTWNRLDNTQYSLDVVLKDGRWIGPCISSGIIGSKLSVDYRGICPSKQDQLASKWDVAYFRLFYSDDGQWVHYVDKAYDGVSDHVSIELPGGRTELVVLEWNEMQTNAEYSLDVRLKSGQWYAPCVGAAVIGHELEYDFNGRCTTANLDVSLREVTLFRMCSAVGGDWAHARCGETPYDGKAMHVFVDIGRP
ncbi:MAG: family 43 glycosylhydrolase, partial [Deltaproteobacteria bacterium]|nr:family 43 glycosylhydrolase [Deltaproteobacteria bacterium]